MTFRQTIGFIGMLIGALLLTGACGGLPIPVLFVASDHLGSVTALVQYRVPAQTDGSVQQYYRYGAYGAMQAYNQTGAAAAPTTELLYNSHTFDADSGLYDYGARVYDPQTARFLTRDPAREHMNPYAYTVWNPVNRTDPSGLQSISYGGDASGFGQSYDFGTLGYWFYTGIDEGLKAMRSDPHETNSTLRDLNAYMDSVDAGAISTGPMGELAIIGTGLVRGGSKILRVSERTRMAFARGASYLFRGDGRLASKIEREGIVAAGTHGDLARALRVDGDSGRFVFLSTDPGIAALYPPDKAVSNLYTVRIGPDWTIIQDPLLTDSTEAVAEWLVPTTDVVGSQIRNHLMTPDGVIHSASRGGPFTPNPPFRP